MKHAFSLRRVLLATLFMAAMPALAEQDTQYQITQRIALAGNAGWDYAYADSAARRLYVTHGAQVHVLDLDSGQQIAQISGLKGAHGVALAAALQRGFISDGGDNAVVIFDLDTFATLAKVPVGANPDGILYDAASQRVLAFNGRSQNVTAIDAASSKVVGTLALGGTPEFPVSDGAGNVYVNIADTDEIVHLDPRALTIQHRWPLAPCADPSGLALDAAGHRLFAVCANKIMAVVNADSGAIVATPAIGAGCDAVVYDATRKRVFASNGAGTLTVIRQDDADHYNVITTVPTEAGARTMAYDTRTQTVYLPTAQRGAAPAPTPDNPHPRPAIVPGTFHLVVVAPVTTTTTAAP